MRPTLTVGMATYDDFDGCYFTLQALRAYHPAGVRIIVIDNAPRICPRTRNVTHAVGGRYLYRPDLTGTSAPRSAVFDAADTDWVMVCDSHVLFESGAVQALLDFAAAHPDSNDLVQGPLVYDDGKTVGTHWRQDNPPGLWGIWDYDPQEKEGWPFEIPMQGLGAFAMRRCAWPGFHPLFRGFGGEEGYLHELVRQRGGRCLCLPALRWRHRFRDMESGGAPPPYRLCATDHTWNLLIGHRELGIEASRQIREFIGKSLKPQDLLDLEDQARQVQPFGRHHPRPKKLRLLGVWYSNNAVSESQLQESLASIKTAVDSSLRHEVRVITCPWRPVLNNPFPQVIAETKRRGYLGIVDQIRQCLVAAADYDYEAVVFLEQDAHYPPGCFDRAGDALASHPEVSLASNVDSEESESFASLLAMRRTAAAEHLDQIEAEARQPELGTQSAAVA